MKYLLDTNVVSELRKIASGAADQRVKQWAERLDSETASLSAVTLLELEVGTLLMERRDKRQGAMLRGWFEDQVLVTFAGRILPVDQPILMRCAAFHVPHPMEYRDSLIAATALVHGMTLVTRNSAHFEPAGIEILNPWKP